MIKDLNKDKLILAKRAKLAKIEDVATVGKDLKDTLMSHIGSCVGMAANMIGIAKAIVAINKGGTGANASIMLNASDPGSITKVKGTNQKEPDILLMFNPVIEKKSPHTYITEEGCLSLDGKREVIRHEWIEVRYRTETWQKKRQRFEGFVAEIIQHEIDHLQGILV